ncbi:MAG TPA: hypothetical protein VMS40_06835 [Vicinamibacterales bacterium]|nr:hypothetical protein [Vicinamibacterales bacterium]
MAFTFIASSSAQKRNCGAGDDHHDADRPAVIAGSIQSLALSTDEPLAEQGARHRCADNKNTVSSFSKIANRAITDRRARHMTIACANKRVRSAARVGHTNVVATLIDTRLKCRRNK